MTTKTNPSQFAPIQAHIERFGLEHIADVAQGVSDAVRSVTLAARRGMKRFTAAMERGYSAELDARAVEADAFLRRSARY
jgi:hypothetical protein